MKSLPWTDERVGELKRLFSEGYSASKIAGFLRGVTRNAVIGKLFRLGLMRGRRINHPANQLRSRLTSRTSKATVKLKPRLRVVTTVSVEALNVSLMDLKPYSCRWPTTDDKPHLFCGHAREGDHTPYCAEHRVMARTTVAKKAKLRPHQPRHSNYGYGVARFDREAA